MDGKGGRVVPRDMQNPIQLAQQDRVNAIDQFFRDRNIGHVAGDQVTTITIPGTFPDMNRIIAASKKHWSEYAKFKRTHTDLVVAAVKNRHEPIADYPVWLAFDWYCKDRRIDPDNIAAAKKMIIDGLVVGGILAGDGWNHICGLSDTFHIDRRNTRVMVSLMAASHIHPKPLKF